MKITKYLKKQTSNPDHSEPYTEEELRNYVEENKLPLTVKYVKEKTSEYYYLVPDEEIDFNTHFDIATQRGNGIFFVGGSLSSSLIRSMVPLRIRFPISFKV